MRIIVVRRKLHFFYRFKAKIYITSVKEYVRVFCFNGSCLYMIQLQKFKNLNQEKAEMEKIEEGYSGWELDDVCVLYNFLVITC